MRNNLNWDNQFQEIYEEINCNAYDKFSIFILCIFQCVYRNLYFGFDISNQYSSTESLNKDLIFLYCMMFWKSVCFCHSLSLSKMIQLIIFLTTSVSLNEKNIRKCYWMRCIISIFVWCPKKRWCIPIM